MNDELKCPGELRARLSGWRRVPAWFWARGTASWQRRVRWTRVLVALAALHMLGYLGCVTLAFAFVRWQREVTAARWIDLALPWRWPHYRVTRGEHLLAEAQRLLAGRKLREAFVHARAGLARVPGHRDGRLLLVEMEHALRGAATARTTLLEGFAYHHADAAYVQPALLFLLREQADATVVALARRHLPGAPAGSEAARLYALGAATAGYRRGDFEQAEDFLRRAPRLAGSRDGRLLRAKIAWERDGPGVALPMWRRLADERPHDAEVQQEFVRRLRSAGLADEARRRSLGFQIAHPELAWPRIALLRAYREEGDASRAAREVDALLRDFGGQQAALLALADFAAEAGESPLAERVLARAAARGWTCEPFLFLAIEAQIGAGRYAEALERIRARRTESPALERRHEALLLSLQAVAALGAGDAERARAALADFLQRDELRADSLLAIANRLVALEAGELAAQVLARALQFEPRHPAVLTRLVELDIVLQRGDALARHVQQLLAVRRPSPDLLRVAQLELGSDRFLFSREVPEALRAMGVALERSVPARGAAVD